MSFEDAFSDAYDEDDDPDDDPEDAERVIRDARMAQTKPIAFNRSMRFAVRVDFLPIPCSRYCRRCRRDHRL